MEWRRVSRPLRGVTAIATVSALAIITAIILIYAWLLGLSETAFTVAMYIAVGAIFTSVWAWRRWSYGVFLDAASIKITYGSGTEFFALRDVAGFEVRPSMTSRRRWPCLWIVARDGIAVQTPVVRGRPRRGLSVSERLAGLYLREPVFDAVVVELTDEIRRGGRSSGETAR